MQKIMNRIAKSFGQGLLVIAPVAITAYVVVFVVTKLDGWFRLPVPGLGLLTTGVIITAIGYLTGNVLGRRALEVLEGVLSRVPIVKLLYGSLRDLFNAFVGDRKSFDRPVIVDLSGDGAIKTLGFVTCDLFDDPQLDGHVAVYLPQAYNVAGNLLVVPRARVRRLDADGAQFMAFIMSGGVAEMNAARTVFEDPMFTVR